MPRLQLRLKRRVKAPAEKRSDRFLAVKLADIGDVLLTLPAIAALREAYPDASVDMMVPPSGAALAKMSPVIDDVIVFDKFQFDSIRSIFRLRSYTRTLQLIYRLRRGHYTKLFLFHHLNTRWGMVKHALVSRASGAKRLYGLDNGRGRFLNDKVKDKGFGYMHEAEYWQQIARLAGAKPSFKRPQINISDEDREWAKVFLGDRDSAKPVVLIHPGSGIFNTARRWFPQRFAAVADALVEEFGAQIVITGGQDEVDLAGTISSLMSTRPLVASGETNLGQLCALLEQATLLIGNDSGVMHLATAVGLPAVAIFGPSNDKAWRPFDWDVAAADSAGPPVASKYVVLRGFTRCSPCLYVGHKIGNKQGCEDRECLNMIGPKEVVDAAATLLRRFNAA